MLNKEEELLRQKEKYNVEVPEMMREMEKDKPSVEEMWRGREKLWRKKGGWFQAREGGGGEIWEDLRGQLNAAWGEMELHLWEKDQGGKG